MFLRNVLFFIFLTSFTLANWEWNGQRWNYVRNNHKYYNTWNNYHMQNNRDVGAAPLPRGRSGQAGLQGLRHEVRHLNNFFFDSWPWEAFIIILGKVFGLAYEIIWHVARASFI